MGAAAAIVIEKSHLLGIDSTTATGTDKENGVIGRHAALNQRDRNHDRSSPEAGHAVHGDARRGADGLGKDRGGQIVPVTDDLLGGRVAILKLPVMNFDTSLLQSLGGVRRLAHAHKRDNIMFLQQLHITVHGRIVGTVGDEKFVALILYQRRVVADIGHDTQRKQQIKGDGEGGEISERRGRDERRGERKTAQPSSFQKEQSNTKALTHQGARRSICENMLRRAPEKLASKGHQDTKEQSGEVSEGKAEA